MTTRPLLPAVPPLPAWPAAPVGSGGSLGLAAPAPAAAGTTYAAIATSPGITLDRGATVAGHPAGSAFPGKPSGGTILPCRSRHTVAPGRTRLAGFGHDEGRLPASAVLSSLDQGYQPMPNRGCRRRLRRPRR